MLKILSTSVIIGLSKSTKEGDDMNIGDKNKEPKRRTGINARGTCEKIGI